MKTVFRTKMRLLTGLAVVCSTAGVAQETVPAPEYSVQTCWLHGAQITFTASGLDEQFRIRYPDGSVAILPFPSLDALGAVRSLHVADYNFDGHEDLAFSLPDAGMGVYRTFRIWLYNAGTRRFKLLAEPEDARAKCSGLCDVTVDRRRRLLFTACRGGARWWRDVYRFDKANRLVWLGSAEGE